MCDCRPLRSNFSASARRNAHFARSQKNSATFNTTNYSETCYARRDDCCKMKKTALACCIIKQFTAPFFAFARAFVALRCLKFNSLIVRREIRFSASVICAHCARLRLLIRCARKNQPIRMRRRFRNIPRFCAHAVVLEQTFLFRFVCCLVIYRSIRRALLRLLVPESPALTAENLAYF